MTNTTIPISIPNAAKPAGPLPNGAVAIWSGTEWVPLYQLAESGTIVHAAIGIGTDGQYILRPATGA
jgi:hypothetical protein